MSHEDAHVPILRIRASDSSPSVSFLSVDRLHDRALFLGLGLFVPVRRAVAPLSMISGVQVTKYERNDSAPRYGIALHLHKGRRIKFGCRSRSQAMAIMKEISRYLGIAHQH